MAQRRGQNEPVLGVDYRQRKITIQNRECGGGSRELGVGRCADTRPSQLSHCGDFPFFLLPDGLLGHFHCLKKVPDTPNVLPHLKSALPWKLVVDKRMSYNFGQKSGNGWVPLLS